MAHKALKDAQSTERDSSVQLVIGQQIIVTRAWNCSNVMLLQHRRNEYLVHRKETTSAGQRWTTEPCRTVPIVQSCGHPRTWQRRARLKQRLERFMFGAALFPSIVSLRLSVSRHATPRRVCKRQTHEW